MKRLFKISLLAVALLAGISADAQEKAIQFGVKGGVNLSNLGGKDAEGTDAKLGFNVGVTLDQAITESFYLQTGLELTTKGAKASQTKTEIYEGAKREIKGETTINAMYLQLSIHGAYKLTITENTKIVFHAGPYLAYGIGGRTTVKSSLNYRGSERSYRQKFNTFGYDALKIVDIGIGGGVGAEFGHIGVNLGSDFGLISVARQGAKVRNQNAHLSLGYRF